MLQPIADPAQLDCAYITMPKQSILASGLDDLAIVKKCIKRDVLMAGGVDVNIACAGKLYKAWSGDWFTIANLSVPILRFDFAYVDSKRADMYLDDVFYCTLHMMLMTVCDDNVLLWGSISAKTHIPLACCVVGTVI